jgi:glycosyltransferase involved in cell wall biosynthesis
MNQALPLVSIIIPAYNADRFIAETIDSVLQQVYTNWELIIINDGSTDDTLRIAEKYSSVNSKIQVITQNNLGVSMARNNGLAKAKGDYLALLDADDVWLKNNLSEKMQVLLADNSLDFVFSNRNLLDEKTKQQTPAPPGSDLNILEDTLLWNGEPVPGPASNLVFKKECFNGPVYFPPELSNIADKYFMVQLSKFYKGKNIKKITFNYRIVGGSMSKNLEVHEKDTLKAYQLYTKTNIFKNANFRRKCFSNMYWIVGASWWKDGDNKLRGLYFILRALFTAPFHTIKKIIKKIIL